MRIKDYEICFDCKVPKEPDGKKHWCAVLGKYVSQKYNRALHKSCNDYSVDPPETQHVNVVAKVMLSYTLPRNTLLKKERDILFVFSDPMDVDRVVENFRAGWERFLAEEKDDMQ